MLFSQCSVKSMIYIPDVFFFEMPLVTLLNYLILTVAVGFLIFYVLVVILKVQDLAYVWYWLFLTTTLDSVLLLPERKYFWKSKTFCGFVHMKWNPMHGCPQWLWLGVILDRVLTVLEGLCIMTNIIMF